MKRDNIYNIEFTWNMLMIGSYTVKSALPICFESVLQILQSNVFIVMKSKQKKIFSVQPQEYFGQNEDIY